MSFLRDVREGVRSLVYWFPIIWQDRDWDYGDTLIVLRHSLKRLYRGIDRYRNHTLWESDLHRIRVAIILLDRLIDGGYSIRSRPLKEPHIVEIINAPDIEIPWNSDDWHYLENQDWEYLWKHISKYMRGWWD